MEKHLGIVCKCRKVVGLEESPEATVEEGIYLEVMRALDGIVSIPADGCMMGYFNLQSVGNNKNMQKAWSIFKAGIMKENNMERFAAFLQQNDDLFLEGVGDRLVVIGNGIKYLYN
ncbi:hypothetical protein SUGI_0632560 [Cryptomeria japonica]|nr:hypothetical protein SUGI_0632560 [Cryptomeria japonica]